jgi:hypothetical protein
VTELEQAVHSMNLAVKALELEVPAMVYLDMLTLWNNVKRHIAINENEDK